MFRIPIYADTDPGPNFYPFGSRSQSGFGFETLFCTSFVLFFPNEEYLGRKFVVIIIFKTLFVSRAGFVPELLRLQPVVLPMSCTNPFHIFVLRTGSRPNETFTPMDFYTDLM